MKIHKRHSSTWSTQRPLLWAACLPAVKVSPIAEEALKSVYPSRGCSQVTGEDADPSLGILLWTRCQQLEAQETPSLDPGVMPTSQKLLISLLLLADSNDWLRSPAPSCSAATNSWWGWSVSTHLIFHSGPSDPEDICLCWAQKKEACPTARQAPAVHRNAWPELCRG